MFVSDEISNEMFNKILKAKHIYKIYESNNTFNIEKYPVIYANKEFVYFKVPGSNHLNHINTKYIIADFEKFYFDCNYSIYNGCHNFFARFFLDVDEEKIRSMYPELKQKRNALAKEKELNKIKSQIDDLQNKLNDLQNKYDKLKTIDMDNPDAILKMMHNS